LGRAFFFSLLALIGDRQEQEASISSFAPINGFRQLIIATTTIALGQQLVSTITFGQ